nr:glycosyltransferase [Alkalibacillus almallahensis]
MSHLSEIENDRLQWYNLLYEKNNFQKIEKIEEQKPLDLENIYNTPLEPSSVEHYKVSVIIPAYNAADLLYVALDSLINQTMKNLEIIVVDDCSSDNTAKVVNEYSRKDSRIKLIQKEVNEGAYAARNTGLLYATGDFITVHDSDDWSHTQKIEIQVKEILKDEKSIGSVSYLVRALKDITPINSTSLIGGKFLTMNSSSLLVKKEVVKMLGGWDSVRVAGDTEYLFRIEKVFGSDSIARVFPNVPLSISLSNENSLTSTSTTNSRTIKFGLRRNYREAFEWWHDSFEEVNQLYLNPAGRHYRFPKPRPILPEKEVEKTYRRIIVVDLSDRSQLDKIKNYIEKLDGSEDIAVFHYPNYENNPDSRITSEVYKLLFNKNLDLLVPNEVATAEEVLFLTPWIYKYELDQIPYLKIKSSTLDNSDNFSDEELKIVKDNIFQMFNVTPKVRPLNTIK